MEDRFINNTLRPLTNEEQWEIFDKINKLYDFLYEREQKIINDYMNRILFPEEKDK